MNHWTAQRAMPAKAAPGRNAPGSDVRLGSDHDTANHASETATMLAAQDVVATGRLKSSRTRFRKAVMSSRRATRPVTVPALRSVALLSRPVTPHAPAEHAART